jgi:hypothetical protein
MRVHIPALMDVPARQLGDLRVIQRPVAALNYNGAPLVGLTLLPADLPAGQPMGADDHLLTRDEISRAVGRLAGEHNTVFVNLITMRRGRHAGGPNAYHYIPIGVGFHGHTAVEDILNTIEEYNGDVDVSQVAALNVLVTRGRAPRGGAQPHCEAMGGILGRHSCLWQALREVFGHDVPTAGVTFNEFAPDGAKSFKRFLGLGVDEPVPLALLPKVDRMLGKSVRLEVIGDTAAESFVGEKTNSMQRVVKLRYISAPPDGEGVGHFEPVLDKGASKVGLAVQRRSGLEDKLMLAKTGVYSGGTLYLLESNGTIFTRQCGLDEYKELRKASVRFINSSGVSPVEALTAWQEDAASCDCVFGGPQKNLVRAYRSFASASMVLFGDTAAPIADVDIEALGDWEERWVRAADLGSITFCDRDYVEKTTPAAQFDVNSAYPAAAASANMIPMREGEFSTLEVLPDVVSVGIYRVVPLPELADTSCRARAVCRSNTPDKAMVYPQERSSYITHHDVRVYRSAGLNPVLVQDQHPNALIYGPGQRMKAADIFGKFINGLYAHKYGPDGTKRGGVKLLLNSFIGSLARRSEMEVHRKASRERLPGPLRSFKTAGEDEYIFRCAVGSKEGGKSSYRYPRWARAAVFIKAAARSIAASHILPNLDRVLRTHTDGFIVRRDPVTTQFLSDVKGKPKLDPRLLGYLKKEKEGFVYMLQLNDIKWK